MNCFERRKLFYVTLYHLFVACVPKKRRRINKDKPYPVWFTQDIIFNVRQKQSSYAWIDILSALTTMLAEYPDEVSFIQSVRRWMDESFDQDSLRPIKFIFYPI